MEIWDSLFFGDGQAGRLKQISLPTLAFFEISSMPLTKHNAYDTIYLTIRLNVK